MKRFPLKFSTMQILWLGKFTFVSQLSFLILLFGSDLAHGGTVTLAPVANTFITDQFPDSPSRNGLTLVAGTQGPSAGSARNRALFKFNSSTIPAQSLITAVTFNLTVTRIPNQPVDSNFELHRLFQNWDESQATWLKPTTAGSAWNAPGGAAGSDFSSIVSSAQLLSGARAYSFGSTPELVADVQSWVNNPGANFGWMLVSDLEDADFTARRLGSRTDLSTTPSIVVEFTTVPEPSTFAFLALSGCYLFWCRCRNR